MGADRDRSARAKSAAKRGSKSNAKRTKKPASDGANTKGAGKASASPRPRRRSKSSELQARIRDLEKQLKERDEAAAAAVARVLTDDEIKAIMAEELHDDFRGDLRELKRIARHGEEEKDRLKAIAMIKDQVAGKVPDKLHGKGLGPWFFVAGLPEPGDPEPTEEEGQREGTEG